MHFRHESLNDFSVGFQPKPIERHLTVVIQTVTLAQSTHASGEMLPPHEHRKAYLSFVIEGEYDEVVGPLRVRCAASHVRFHPAGEIHSNSFGRTGGRVLNLELDHCWNGEIESLDLSNPDDAVLLTDGAWPAMMAWREFRRPRPDSALVLEEIVATLLARTQKARVESESQRRHRIVRRAVEFLRASPTARLSLFDVAAAAGVHTTHLARVFRRGMGCTVGGYARRLRAEQALECMRRHPRWPLSRVAAETGFADHAHCTRVFRRVFGVAPSHVRRVQREIAATR
jgi:AraC family transcriptional regulator